MRYLDKDMDTVIQQYGLENLDDDDKIVVFRMLNNNTDYKQKDVFLSFEIRSIAVIYTQNYLLLKQLLQINMKNKEIVDKNNELVEQNNKLIQQNEILQQQNNQIIELLQKIADK
ncbi:MAG: hypothetical protein K2P09_02835 [Erysipelotrichales bacterium]|nr:hypothetical protein [Erysipelotrichales bacterium]